MGNPYYLSKQFLDAKLSYFVTQILDDYEGRIKNGWQVDQVTITRGTLGVLERISESPESKEFVLREVEDQETKERREEFFGILHRGYGRRFGAKLRKAFEERGIKTKIDLVDTAPKPRPTDSSSYWERETWVIETDEWFRLYDKTFRDSQFITSKERVSVG